MSVSIDSSDSKKLYIRVEFLNRLSEFLNEHAEVYPAIHALPTKSLKKIQKRRKIIKNSITHCLSLTMHIPESEDSDFIADTTRYLKLICAQLISADERYSHLEAWSHGNERYSLSQDAAYMKHIRNIEGEIALCGRLMNSYKYDCLLAIHPERALKIGRLILRETQDSKYLQFDSHLNGWLNSNNYNKLKGRTMFLLRFAKNDQDAEYATTAQTLTEANKCVNNVTNILREHDKLQSMKKAGNSYYVYELATGDSLHLYVSRPTEIWYQLQFLDDDEKVIRAYKLQNIDKASQLIFKNRGLEYKLFIIADNEPIEYTDPESPDFIEFVEDESEDEDEDSDTETKPNAVDEYSWALPVAVLIAGVLSIATLVSASSNGGYISPSAYWPLVAALVIAIAITRTKLKSINTHTFCHVALGVPVFFAIATIILGTMIRLTSLNSSTESTDESTSLTIATNLEGADDYVQAGATLGTIGGGAVDVGLLLLLYKMATSDSTKRGD